MAKMRVYELAKQLDVQSKLITDFLAEKGTDVKAASNIDEDLIDLVSKHFAKDDDAAKQAEEAKPPEKEITEKELPAKENPEKEIPEKKTAAPTAPEKEKPAPAKETPAPEKTAVEGPSPERKKAPADGEKRTLVRKRRSADQPVKKKKNISVVVNSQYSGRSGKRDDKRPAGRGGRGSEERRGKDGQRTFRTGAVHTIIRPRPDGERRRPRATMEPAPQSVEKKRPEPAAPITPPAAEPPAPEKKPAAPVIEGPIIRGKVKLPRDVVRRPNPSDAPPKPADDSRGKGGRDGGRKKRSGQARDGQNTRRQERFVNLEKTSAKKRQKGGASRQPARSEDEILTLVLPEHLTIRELADKMKVAATEVVKKLFLKGTMVTVNQDIDYEQAEEIALEFNCVCEPEEKVDLIGELLKEEEENEKDLETRPPVVCVMGHVDHGKTSLLDAIRDTHVIDREAGGITQKIGAYVVSINGQKITFLDTPGHEAFTAMRMRGANSTDIAILVVAADDGVMPQTIEAINHARAAGIEIIVAINKIDKPGANVERVKKELSEYELVSEDWGGSTVFVPVSAHTHEGIDELLEMILLTSEVLELKANPKRNARGLVIEAELDKGRGVVATVLVQKGTLHVGDPVAAGQAHGKVRAMIDENGKRLKKAGPSTPVEIQGLSEVPNAGEIFVAMDNDREARSFAETFVTVGKDKLVEETRSKMSLDDLFSQIQAGNVKELNIIVKADVQGSVEAVRQSLLKLSNDEVVVRIIHGGVGAITESDVSLAAASNAIIIGFNVRPDNIAKQSAEAEGIDVRLYNVIYNIIEDVEGAMKGMLEPIYEEKIIGHAQVRQIFKASDVGSIAGSYVTDGFLQRDCKVRIRRGEEQIFEGGLASLKRFKDNVKEVKSGFECGLVFDGFHEFDVDDEIEAYIMVEVPR